MPRWLLLGFAGLLALVGFQAVRHSSAFSGGSRWYSSPREIRLSSEPGFVQCFDPKRQIPVTDLVRTPAPALQVNRTATEIKVGFQGPEHSTLDHQYEIFPADPSGLVPLPDGNRLQLAGIAILLPSDVEWGTERSAQKVPEWIDPATGQVIVPGPGTEWAGRKQSVPRSGPRLFLRVKKLGTAPLRWHWPEAYDARTYQKMHSMATHSMEAEDGQFSIDLQTWHQTPIRLGVRFAFGDPRVEVLALKRGAWVEFGADARVEVIDDLPGGQFRALGRRWQSGEGTIRYEATFAGLPPAPVSAEQAAKQRGLILQVWPPVNHGLITAMTPGPKAELQLSGSDGIGGIELSGKESTGLTELRLRRFPRQGRAVFEITKIPRLPEVDNLFDSPIPLTWVDSWDYARQAAAAVEARSYLNDAPIPLGAFPLKLENTTPGRMLQDIERQSGKRIYYRENESLLTTQPPKSWWEKVKEWWNRMVP
jgi:hypothetical protein